jgi:hypothetical protein
MLLQLQKRLVTCGVLDSWSIEVGVVYDGFDITGLMRF